MSRVTPSEHRSKGLLNRNQHGPWSDDDSPDTDTSRSQSKQDLDPQQRYSKPILPSHSRIMSQEARYQSLKPGEKVLIVLNQTVGRLSQSWLTHLMLVIALILYTLIGGLVFKLIEGNDESNAKKDLFEGRMKAAHEIQDVSSKYTSLAGDKKEEHSKEVKKVLQEYENSILDNYNYNGKMDRGQDELNWAYTSSVFFCFTVYTTLGYGHLAPGTTLGRVVFMLYAIIGIPLFLIILTDFGKLMTRGLKKVWWYGRKLYYSNLCQQGKGQLQKTVKVMTAEERTGRDFDEEIVIKKDEKNFQVDEKFNVPVEVAVAIWFMYMIIGSICFAAWENYAFFESLYFVFISMSTIGFGDLVPQNYSAMIASMFFLGVGLAIATMCLQVFREELIKSLADATSKFGEQYGVDIQLNTQELLEENADKK
ncbi:TWiK family of potassium channels protein 18-like isoform X2 [Cimex lectularius]|uniref:Potassium channel domain-containing protein n=1 Tax=Cimex lectularius TaxID=79782 RepID=A0A8I6R9Z5_CIMLE|nr:TWiK family of potassium channels protein 18-like isoform X2 [Cimex lectularius]XP_014241789.1 TWiK family of potassium channels protein 18-like isoform X2 [Cimex lectularius]